MVLHRFRLHRSRIFFGKGCTFALSSHFVPLPVALGETLLTLHNVDEHNEWRLIFSNTYEHTERFAEEWTPMDTTHCGTMYGLK